jgi:hypothetical protein
MKLINLTEAEVKLHFLLLNIIFMFSAENAAEQECSYNTTVWE